MNVKGIYQSTQINTYKPGYFIQVDIGLLKDKKLEIFSSYENNKLVQKLYYLSDSVGHLVREKLVDKNKGKLLDIIG